MEWFLKAILWLTISAPVLMFLIVKITTWAGWKYYSRKGNMEMAEHAHRLFRQSSIRTLIEAYNYEQSNKRNK